MDLFKNYYTKAIKFLSYRPRSEKEVRDKLLIKINKGKSIRLGYVISTSSLSRRRNPKEISRDARDDNVLNIIDQVIDKLKEQRFINDEEFAGWWIEQRMEFKPRSLSLIKRELKQKGISQDIVESRIKNQELRGEADLEQAKKLVLKKIQKYKNLPKQDIYQKLGSFLARKGFDWDTVKESIDEVVK